MVLLCLAYGACLGLTQGDAVYCVNYGPYASQEVYRVPVPLFIDIGNKKTRRTRRTNQRLAYHGYRECIDLAIYSTRPILDLGQAELLARWDMRTMVRTRKLVSFPSYYLQPSFQQFRYLNIFFLKKTTINSNSHVHYCH